MKRLSALLSQVNKTEIRESMDNVTLPIRLLGLRGSGKTSFLYRVYFKYGTEQPDTVFDVIATPHHNVEVVPYDSHLYEIWDFPEMSSCLNHIKDTAVILYFIDSVSAHKKGVIAKTKENMIWLLQQFSKLLENTVIVTIANKQDHPEAMDIQSLGNEWANDKVLMDLLKGHAWRIFPCHSLTGYGMEDIMQYVTSKVEKRTSFTSSRSIRRYSSNHSQNDMVTPWESIQNPYHFNDTEFYQWFSMGKAFLFFDLECLIRIIYITLIKKKKWNPLLNQLQLVLSQCQPSNQHPSIDYSETQTLFWIQMVSFALLKLPVLEGQNDEFESFIMRYPFDHDCWKAYYSHKVFYSDKSAKEFFPPDKKSLPNAFKSSSLALKGSGLKIDYQIL